MSKTAQGERLQELSDEARNCRACDLWKNATQTVFGAGPGTARIMLVGEQPGDQEDLAGEPFVGPAGKLLDRALEDAGVDRKRTYITNAVKHFKFELRGKRRIHKTPAEKEIEACRRWLERELATVSPAVVVALGGTAARALLGRATPIGVNRGKLRDLTPECKLLITVHPSFLLRVPPEDQAAEYKRFVADLTLAAGF